jgi:predicted DNA-binding transcriptional regulator AlpA
MTKHLDIDELVALLGQSTQTINKKLRSVPHQPPPKMHIPGSKMLRWRTHEVENWRIETGRSKVTAK